MHISIEEIRELAQFYLNGTILDDKQLEKKRHMADCDACYQLFCAEYFLQKKLTEMSLLPEEVFTEESILQQPIENFFIQITKVGEKLNLLVQSALTNERDWEFIHMPRLAVQSRGSNDREEIFDKYEHRNSKKSFVSYDKSKIVIQLDGDLFPVDHLAVEAKDGLNEARYKFQYDPETEYYRVCIDNDLYTDDVIIQIVEDMDER